MEGDVGVRNTVEKEKEKKKKKNVRGFTDLECVANKQNAPARFTR